MIYYHTKYNNLNIVFTDRLGGYSSDTSGADYAAMNLGFHVGDDPDRVRKNYTEVFGKLGIKGRKTAIARQVHGTGAVESSRIACDLNDFIWEKSAEADIIELSDPENIAVMLFADCLPLILFDSKKVVLVHVGWKGLVADIVGISISRFDELCDIIAIIGPGIDSCCYEVNSDIAEQVKNLFSNKAEIEGVVNESDNKYRLSIKSAVQRQLNEKGVGNIITASPCTGCDNDIFFSHRKSSQQGKVTGRQASIVWFD